MGAVGEEPRPGVGEVEARAGGQELHFSYFQTCLRTLEAGEEGVEEEGVVVVMTLVYPDFRKLYPDHRKLYYQEELVDSEVSLCGGLCWCLVMILAVQATL